MKERVYSKQDLQKRYNVSRETIENWMKNYGLNMIRVNSHSKFIREEDLHKWEQERMVGGTTGITYVNTLINVVKGD